MIVRTVTWEFSNLRVIATTMCKRHIAVSMALPTAKLLAYLETAVKLYLSPVSCLLELDFGIASMILMVVVCLHGTGVRSYLQ